MSFSAISFFCSGVRPSYHSIVTIGMRASARPASAGSSSATSRFFGIAPMTFFATCPFLNRISVGIESTSYCCGGLLVLVDVELRPR